MVSESLTRSQVLRRAWPLVFANAAVPLAAAADTFVLGLSGDTTDLGGVALGGAIISIFLWSFYFLRMGSTGLVAQAAGMGEEGEAQRILVRALVVAVVLGTVVAVLRGPIAAAGLAIMQGQPSVNVKGAAYLTARALGAPGALAVFALTGWLIGVRRTGTTLVITVIFSLVNIALDLWFVLGLHLGPAGVGSATAIADWVAFAIGLLFVMRTVRARGGWVEGALRPSALLDLAAMRRLFDVNVNLMIRTWTLILGFTWFVNAGARQGVASLAGNQVLQQIIAISAFVLDAFAFVAEAEAGRAFSRSSLAEFRRACLLAAEPAMIAGTLFAVLTFVFGPSVLTAMIADPTARDAAIAYLPYGAVVPVLGAPAWILDGIFIGATRGAMLRNAGIASVLVYIAADLTLAPRFGNTGVWLAFLIFYVARGVALAAYLPSLAARIAEPSLPGSGGVQR
jgi:MATE family multidrug resistance protein